MRRSLTLCSNATAVALLGLALGAGGVGWAGCGPSGAPGAGQSSQATQPAPTTAHAGEQGEERGDEAAIGTEENSDNGAESEESPALAGPRRVTIGASGDLLVHIKVIRAAEEHADQGRFGHVLGVLPELTAGVDLSFANLEGPLSMRVDIYSGSPPILGAPADVVAPALPAAGLDVVSVANNHSYDQGIDGLIETVAALERAHIRAIGQGPDGPRSPGTWIVERNGVRVAFMAFTERINRGPGYQGAPLRASRYSDERAAAALREARERADFVVLSIHWSHDFYDAPMHRQRVRARFLVENGADLIVGHGPHVMHEVERLPSPRGDAICAYSLGNLLSNQGLRFRAGHRPPRGIHRALVMPEVRDGVWLRVTAEIPEPGRVRILPVEGVPLFTHNNFLARERDEEERVDIRVARLREEGAEVRDARLPVIARTLGPEVHLVDHEIDGAAAEAVSSAAGE